MYDISVNDMRDTSTTDLEGIKRRIEQELTRRRNVERERLITDFRRAWGELRDMGIRVSYSDDYDCDTTYLDQWDGFNFD